MKFHVCKTDVLAGDVKNAVTSFVAVFKFPDIQYVAHQRSTIMLYGMHLWTEQS